MYTLKSNLKVLSIPSNEKGQALISLAIVSICVILFLVASAKWGASISDLPSVDYILDAAAKSPRTKPYTVTSRGVIKNDTAFDQTNPNSIVNQITTALAARDDIEGVAVGVHHFSVRYKPNRMVRNISANGNLAPPYGWRNSSWLDTRATAQPMYCTMGGLLSYNNSTPNFASSGVGAADLETARLETWYACNDLVSSITEYERMPCMAHDSNGQLGNMSCVGVSFTQTTGLGFLSDESRRAYIIFPNNSNITLSNINATNANLQSHSSD